MTDTPPEPDALSGAPHPRLTLKLYGQDAAAREFLATARAGRIPHGWLLTGPGGIGKATLAWQIATHMLGPTAADTGRLSRDRSTWHAVTQLAHPGLHLCRRDWDTERNRAKTAIGVDAIRALKRFFQLSTSNGGWRVAIVDSVDELTVPAANALLKILEEPPENALLLLICQNPSAILPTLRSRCRVLRCAPLDPPDLRDALRAAGAPEDVTRDVSLLDALAHGSVGKAFDLTARGGLGIYGEVGSILASAHPMERRRILRLAQSCTGGAGPDDARLILELTETAIGRLALVACGRVCPPLTEHEARAQARLATAPAQGPLWAALVPRIRRRAATALTVNLDPADVIIDTFREIDATAAAALDITA